MLRAAAACRDKHRRSAGRAEAPPCGGSQNSPRGLRHENICATSRQRRTKSRCRYLCRTKIVSRLRLAQFCELQNRQKPAQNNRKRTTIFRNPPAPLRRQRTAESTDHAGASRSLHHSGHSDCFQRKTVWQNKLPPITERQTSESMAVQCFRILPSCPGIPAAAPPGRGNAATQRRYAVCGS